MYIINQVFVSGIDPIGQIGFPAFQPDGIAYSCVEKSLIAQETMHILPRTLNDSGIQHFRFFHYAGSKLEIGSILLVFLMPHIVQPNLVWYKAKQKCIGPLWHNAVQLILQNAFFEVPVGLQFNINLTKQVFVFFKVFSGRTTLQYHQTCCNNGDKEKSYKRSRHESGCEILGRKPRSKLLKCW